MIKEWSDDMSMAPRSYKPILACDPSKGYEAIVVHNGAEWELLSHDGFPMGIGFYPTHWCELPPAPTLEEAKAEIDEQIGRVA